MDFVTRLILLLALVVFSVDSGAHGLGSYGVQNTYYVACSNGSSTPGASSPDAGVAACVAKFTYTGSAFVNGCTRTVTHVGFVSATSTNNITGTVYHTIKANRTYSTPGTCQPQPADVATMGEAVVTKDSVTGCVAGSSLIPGSTNQCECNLGYKPDPANPGKCTPYTCTAAGSYSAVTQPDQLVPNAGDNQCDAGCEMKPSSWKAAPDGKIWASWPFVSTGKTCGGAKSVAEPKYNTGDLNNKNPAPVACPANQCPGQVNGADVCVACSGTKVEGPSTSASGTTPGTAGSGDIKGSTTTTDCSGTTCTTTTTYKDASGNTVGTISETKDQKSFCQENPTLSICKESAFGGNCAGGFTCSGDGVQCALAREVHRSNCEWSKEDPGQKSAFQNAMATAGQAQPAGHPGAEGEVTSMTFSSAIDQTNRLGGGCPVDVSISYGGRSWVIPWSQHCDKLQLIGNLMVSVCMLAAAFIVFRS